MYVPRTYRANQDDGDLHHLRIAVSETDLWIGLRAPGDLLPCIREQAEAKVLSLRRNLKSHMAFHPHFKDSLVPLPYSQDDPAIVKRMSEAAAKVGVGPMAAVAGTIAEMVGEVILSMCSELIVENGGDIFLFCRQRRRIGILAGSSPLSGKIAILAPTNIPVGICTSAGTSGHSLSIGRADAAVVMSQDTALADAAATKAGNLVQEASGIQSAIEQVSKIPGVMGVLIIKDDKLGAWGNIELEPL
ncbi:MAG: UPF0280 family protein [Limnochordia bacterium]|jgi:ApbE superfamily uncharacterized protein (UPF0280 family)|nr:UPF0280 family protein [Limnochordia bacterium]MDD2630075.1 UPF0280 family protein [Limnochordia bacterium]MDD4518367.1 UPF0280 family protein [Limnochordia bacterium]